MIFFFFSIMHISILKNEYVNTVLLTSISFFTFPYNINSFFFFFSFLVAFFLSFSQNWIASRKNSNDVNKMNNKIGCPLKRKGPTIAEITEIIRKSTSCLILSKVWRRQWNCVIQVVGELQGKESRSCCIVHSINNIS